ncbi:MAG: hypothetical protein ACR5KV_05085 [Wolbachia sp.]
MKSNDRRTAYWNIRNTAESTSRGTSITIKRREDKKIIKDILDMKEEFGSLPNLESTIIEQLNIQPGQGR